MSLFNTVLNFAKYVLDSFGYHGLVGIFLLMILQGATLPIVPSEVMMPFAGYLAFTGQFYFWTAVVVACIGSLLGNMIDFAIGYYYGRPFILHYGRYIHLNEKHLATSERWFARYGAITVLLARFVPLISTLVAFPAGTSKMNVGKFIGFSVVGIFIWDAALAAVGFEVGNLSKVVNIAHDLDTAFIVIGIVAVVIAIVAIFFRARKRTPSESAEKPSVQ